MGLEKKCEFVEDFVKMEEKEILQYDCIIVDEAQFCKKEEISFFVHVVDDLSIPVICYDFRRELFEGSMWLLAWADVIEELKTVCWCGQGATCNVRFSEDGTVIRAGEQVVLGGNDRYTALCRKHYAQGNLGPDHQQDPS